MFGKEKKKEELIMRLPEIYTILQREHHISPGDFPNVVKMQVSWVTLPPKFRIIHMATSQMAPYSLALLLTRALVKVSAEKKNRVPFGTLGRLQDQIPELTR